MSINIVHNVGTYFNLGLWLFPESVQFFYDILFSTSRTKFVFILSITVIIVVVLLLILKQNNYML